MHFESTASVWFSLSLPAIVLLYLFKRKYIDTPVSSHLLWNRVLKDLEANRPWQRLRNRLLMLVQLLAAALLVLALMNPFIWSDRKAKSHVVLVLDRSASMSSSASAAQGAAPVSRLDLAKRQALDWLSDQAARSEITLVTMGETAEVPVSREKELGKVRDAMSKMEPAYGQTAYKEALSLAAALTRNDPDAEIRVYTDGQIPEPLTGLSFAVPVTVVRATHQDALPMPAGNASISQFGVKSAKGPSGSVSAAASIRNWGDATRDIELSVFAGRELASVRKVTVEAGRQASVFVEGLPLADWYKLQINGSDTMTADNASYAFLEGDRPKRALLVGAGNLFLEKALQLAGAEITKLSPDGADAWARGHKAEDGPDLLVLDAVSADAIASKEWGRLLESKPVLYIRSGYSGTEKQVAPGAYSVEEHPVTRYLTFGDAHFASALAPDSISWGKAVVSAGNVPLIVAGTEHGQPRVLLTFSLLQTDLPLRTEFPVLVQNMLEWLVSSQGGSLGRAVALERKEIAVSPRTLSARWVPVDTETPLQPIEAEASGGRLSAFQTVPSKPGLYRLEERDEAGQLVQSRWLGVTSDPKESTGATQELVFEASDTGAGKPAGGEQPASATGSGKGAPLPLWRLFILLVLAAVVWEWGVYRRGASI